MRERPYIGGKYIGPTYSLASSMLVCSGCGFMAPVGRYNNMQTPEGGVVMLRHLRDEHGYEPPHPLQDWQEHIDPYWEAER